MPSQSTANTYRFKGKVWRLLPNQYTGCLGVEVRDTQSLQVFFCILSPGLLKTQLDHLQLTEKWWVSLAGFNEDVLYVHGFDQQGTIGQPMGVTAVSLQTQKELFTLPTALFETVHENRLYCTLAGEMPRKLFVYDAITGDKLGALSDEQADMLSENRVRKPLVPVAYPQVFEAGSNFYADLATFLSGQGFAKTEHPIEYLETDTCFILSYYVAQENGLFDKFLVTYSLKGEALYELRLVKDAERTGGSAFFVQSGFLFLLQPETELTAVPLPMHVNFD